MKRLGGTLQPNSGAGAVHKDDGRVPFKLRLEHKYTTADHFRLDSADFEVLARRALRCGELPIFLIDFVGYDCQLAVVPEATAEEHALGEVANVVVCRGRGRRLRVQSLRYRITRLEFDAVTLEVVPWDALEDRLTAAFDLASA